MVVMMLTPLLTAMNETPVPVVEKPVQQEVTANRAGRYEVVKTLLEEAEGFDAMFEYADAFGTIRAGWISNNLPQNDAWAAALGGQFGFDTASYSGTKLRVAAYTSQKISASNPDDNDMAADFFDADGNAFTYLAVAAIAYEYGNIQAMAGRIRIDTPYADSDDIRMAPNTFEGASARLEAGGSVEVQVFFLHGWAGFGSGEEQDRFKPLFEDANGERGWGAAGASAGYRFDDVNELALWYYHIDRMASIADLEASGQFAFAEAFQMEYGLQGSSISELDDSAVKGHVVGVMGMLYYGGVFGGAAYNRGFVGGDSMITDGFGGGPYYTSLDEATIGAVSGAAAGEDVSSFRIGLGVDFGEYGVQGLAVEAVHGTLKSDESVKIRENDIIVMYDITQRWHFEAVYASYRNKNDSSDRLDRTVIRLDYSF